jgi:uncharacterized membrane protein
MPTTKRKGLALLIAFVAALATALLVARSTPDGNLVVTLVPAILVGALAYLLASRWLRNP